MKKAVTAIVAALLLSALVQADSYIKQSSHVDGFQMAGRTQPATDDTVEQWIGNNQMAMITKGRSTVLDLSKNALFVINHNAKTYVEMALPLDLTKYFPPQMAQMMGSTTVTVTPNGQTQQIGQWKCDGYDMTTNMMGGMMTIKSTVWASKDVPIDWQMLSEKMMPLITQASMRLTEEAVKEFSKIKGFQVKSDSTMLMMGNEVKMRMETIEISTKPAPAGVYEVPAGYTKQEQFSPQDMMR